MDQFLDEWKHGGSNRSLWANPRNWRAVKTAVEATGANGAFMVMDLPLVRGPNRLEAKEKARETERSGRDRPSPLSVSRSLSLISVSVSFVCLCLGLCLQS